MVVATGVGAVRKPPLPSLILTLSRQGRRNFAVVMQVLGQRAVDPFALRYNTGHKARAAEWWLQPE